MPKYDIFVWPYVLLIKWFITILSQFKRISCRGEADRIKGVEKVEEEKKKKKVEERKRSCYFTDSAILTVWQGKSLSLVYKPLLFFLGVRILQFCPGWVQTWSLQIAVLKADTCFILLNKKLKLNGKIFKKKQQQHQLNGKIFKILVFSGFPHPHGKGTEKPNMLYYKN